MREIRGRSWIVARTPKGMRRLAVLACVVLTAFLCQKPAIAEEAPPLESVQIMSGNYRKGGGVGVIGHLGGVPVSIPKEFAHFVEYDGDLNFLEKRTGSVPKRTFESGIRSFGFEIRYPDMAPVNEQSWKEKRTKTIHNTMWMRVGILSNSAYGYNGSDKTTRFAERSLKDARRWHHYEEQQQKIHGLTAFVPTDIDPSRRDISSANSKGGDFYDENIYIYQVKDRGGDAYINCSNVNHEAAPCTHRFMLAPQMKASVRVSYRKGLLPYWWEIQDGITKVLLSFSVAPLGPPSTPDQSSSSTLFKTPE